MNLSDIPLGELISTVVEREVATSTLIKRYNEILDTEDTRLFHLIIANDELALIDYLLDNTPSGILPPPIYNQLITKYKSEHPQLDY
jgi:hypothetical protein